MTRRSIIAASLVALAAIAIVILFPWRESPPPPTALPSPETAPPASVAAMEPIRAPSQPHPGPVSAPRSARIRSEFENAPSYASFIQAALGRPQEGGKFYALLAWQRCNEVRAYEGLERGDDSGSEAFRQRATTLFASLSQRCAGVREQYPDLPALLHVANDSRGGADALVPEQGRGLIAAAGAATADADLDAALRSGDPYAIATVLEANATFLGPGIDPAFNEAGADQTILDRASAIVGCELLGNCVGGPQVALPCAALGDCSREDYRDVIRAQVSAAELPIFDKVLNALRRRVGLPQAPSNPPPPVPAGG